MGTELTGPSLSRTVKPSGRAKDFENTAVDYYFEAHYESGVKLVVSSRVRRGVTLEGSDGWIWVNCGAIEASTASRLDYEPGPNEIRLYRSGNIKAILLIA
jgi:hypothetical protein